MDYLTHVQNAIEYIEQNLDQDIKTVDVAKEVAFSMYHFHRVFQAVVGDTVTAYIRKRRLTEAAFELIDTNKKIIEIAFDYQFETPESFTRAFKRMYGITPGKYRKRKIQDVFVQRQKIDGSILKHLYGGISMEPKIITKAEFNVVGMPYFGTNQNNEIKQMWDQFVPRMGEIKNQINKKTSYGVCGPVEDIDDQSEFEYIAGLEVDSLAGIPEGMVGKTVPEQRYAVFTHKGSVDKIGETYK